MADPKMEPRSRYYDALLSLLDKDIKPELSSPRALHAFKYARRQIARLASVNDFVPCLPESMAALHPDSKNAGLAKLSGKDINAALIDEGRLLDAMESASDARIYSGAKQTAETTTSLPKTITDQTVQAYLREHLDPKISVSNLRILSGGRSKQTILFSTVNDAGVSEDLVIRRDLSTSPTGGNVPEEFPVLQAMARHKFPVPYPLLCEPDPSKLGSPLIVVKRVPGALIGHVFEATSKAAVLDSARVLGRLHTIPLADVAPTLRERYQAAPDAKKIRELVLEFQQNWNENSRAPSVTMEFAFKWMLDTVDSLHPIATVVHGDYSYHNILFENDKVSAVLDWELVRAGHPAEDLAYCRAAALQQVTWDEFTAAYRAGGGPVIDPTDQMFYTLQERIRLMLMLFRARGYVESGFTDDIELVDAMVWAIPRLIHQMSVEIRNYLGLKA
jgi:aminoglycoside phosphotransferase (APT) family kinase protein